jgi:outer membrane protein assembly factor BamA
MPQAPSSALEREVVALRLRVKQLEKRLAHLEGRLAAAPRPNAKPLGRVGQIFIVGNTETRQSVILGQLPFKPGDLVSDADLGLAERRLDLLNIFVIDPARDIRPTITILDADKADIKDILIEVEEK